MDKTLVKKLFLTWLLFFIVPILMFGVEWPGVSDQASEDCIEYSYPKEQDATLVNEIYQEGKVYTVEKGYEAAGEPTVLYACDKSSLRLSAAASDMFNFVWPIMFVYPPLYLAAMLRAYFVSIRKGNRASDVAGDTKSVSMFIAVGYVLWAAYPLYYVLTCVGKFCGMFAAIMSVPYLMVFNFDMGSEVISAFVGLLSGGVFVYYFSTFVISRVARKSE